MRVQSGLTTRKVAELSRVVAGDQGNDEYAISHARLVQIEKAESTPGIHKLFTLSVVYGVAVAELLSLYLDLGSANRLHASLRLPGTHLTTFDEWAGVVAFPFPMASGSTGQDMGTRLLPAVVRRGAPNPGSMPDSFNRPGTRCGFIGYSDYTMYPLIRPRSVVQIDDSQRAAKPAHYRTELERPVYFLETRSGHVCSWCEIENNALVSIPHPLSPCRARVFAYPSEAEIVGRVIGVVMRLGEERLPEASYGEAGRDGAKPIRA